MSDALAHIAPQVLVVDLSDGRAISLEPIRMRQVGPLARSVDLIWPRLLQIFGDGRREPTMADVVDLLATSADELMDAVAICAAMPAADVAGLRPDDFALLAVGCLEVNADFFERAAARLKAATPTVAPNMMRRLARFADGQAPSPQSEPSQPNQTAATQPPSTA